MEIAECVDETAVKQVGKFPPLLVRETGVMPV